MVPFLFYNISIKNQEWRIAMTKTVADLIAYLQTLPLDAEVSIMAEDSRGFGTYTRFANDVDFEYDCELLDFRGDHIPDHYLGKGKAFVFIGRR